MIYQGSKARLVKYIVPILQNCIDERQVETYIEPFVGGANVIDHIKCKSRIGTDNNKELIGLLKYMQNNPKLDIFPDNCTFEHYADVRENRKYHTGKYSEVYTAGIGYFASYGGRYFDGGYGRDKTGKRNIYAERLSYAREQAPLLRDITFSCEDYSHFIGVENAVFYLDPPYRNTKVYNSKAGFNYEEFYDFVRELAKHNYVFISEYSMPKDFKSIWKMERKVYQKSDRQQAETATENLFIYDLWSKYE